MTWLAFRRHRTGLIIAIGITVALGMWMVLLAHGFDTAPVTTYHYPGGALGHYKDLYQGPTILRLPYQADVVSFMLLALPCALGILLGVPLVAGELEDHTNRIAWTQRISRTKWLATKWWVVGIPLLILSAFVVLVTEWWSHHVVMTDFGSLFGSLFGPDYFRGPSRMRPDAFSTTGVVPVAYTLFAFALGAAFGALVRRVSWSIAGTIVTYALVSLIKVTTVRPGLAPQTFVRYAMPGNSATNPLSQLGAGAPWYIGSGYRFVPGSIQPAGQSAGEIGRHCETLQTDYYGCIGRSHLQEGEFFQPASNYWTLQWKESLIYVIASAFLLMLGLWLVRRWRA